MGMHVGGPDAWHVEPYKDFIVAMHWVNHEPAMVLCPRFRAMPGAGAYVLPMDNLHELVKAGSRGEGVDGTALQEKATRACIAMGFGREDWSAIKTVADAILSNIDKLLDMPPEPEIIARKKASHGAIIIREGDKIINEIDVNLDPDD